MKSIPLIVIFLVSMTIILTPISAQNVEISGKQLLVDNQPYFMKGICYHPVPKGETTRNFNNIDQDLKLMSQAGINTIRVYAPIDDIKTFTKQY